MLNKLKYLPCLKAKTAEIHAVKTFYERLTDKSLKVLFEVDHDIDREDAEKLCLKLGNAVGENQVLIDLSTRNATEVNWFISEYKKAKLNIALCIDLQANREAIASAVRVNAFNGGGIAIRFNPLQMLEPFFIRRLESISLDMGCNVSDIDLIIDAGYVDSDEAVGWQNHIIHQGLGLICSMGEWRNVVILSSAFPKSLADTVGKNASRIFHRFDRDLFDSVTKLNPDTDLVFGDYCIQHPSREPAPNFAPAPNLRYSLFDSTYVTRTDIYTPWACTKELCWGLMEQPIFMGSAFSPADNHIKDRAYELVGPGNPMIWRTVGTIHHIQLELTR